MILGSVMLKNVKICNSRYVSNTRVSLTRRKSIALPHLIHLKTLSQIMHEENCILGECHNRQRAQRRTQTNVSARVRVGKHGSPITTPAGTMPRMDR
jgi:hypothetical protein